MSDAWVFPRIVDFWDYRTGAILEGAAQLEKLAENERQSSLADLGAEVRKHVRVLEDSWLVVVAYTVAEDIYKSIFRGFRWSEHEADYLAASAGVFFDELSKRGFVLNYVIDNSASEEQFGPMLHIVPAVLSSAGLVVAGPQLQALASMEADGRQPDTAAIPAYVDKGKFLADALVTRCQQQRRHYVFLNVELDTAEASGVSFAKAKVDAGKPGVIVVFRNQPPVAGTRIQVVPPKGMILPS